MSFSSFNYKNLKLIYIVKDPDEITVVTDIMKNFKKELHSVLEMLRSIEDEINLAGYSLTEKKVFFTINDLNMQNTACNISDVIESSGLSRSTVYKAIKKLESNDMLQLSQSSFDKREFFLDLSV